MTPKGKAKELFKKYSKGKDKYGWSLCEWDSGAKDCALIAVNEILKISLSYAGKDYEFYQEVKKEIELM